MNLSTELRFAPAVAEMAAFLEPFRPWLESVLGGPLSESLTFEIDMPFGELVVEDLLEGAPLDRQCLAGAEPLRPLVERWALPSDTSPRIDLSPSRDRRALVTAREPAWDPHWRETPVALWFHALEHPVVAVRIPYVSFHEGLSSQVRSWMLVRRDDVVAALELLRHILGAARKVVDVRGGEPVLLPEDGYDWGAVVLDGALARLVRDDFEAFLARETWFRRHRLPYRRGYFLYGPPGNGKTTIVRVMASHPAITAYSLNFSAEQLHNEDLSAVFGSAGRTAPSLVIFEDLDRLYGSGDCSDNLTRITLQHLLNCLDGLGSHDGVIVVATANDPTVLDPAILRRPGRFDRAVACRPPTIELRGEYLERLSVEPCEEGILHRVAAETDGFSYAQLREAFILGGQLAFQRGAADITGEDLLEGCRLVRGEGQAVGRRVEAREVGFGSSARSSSRLVGRGERPAPGSGASS